MGKAKETATRATGASAEIDRHRVQLAKLASEREPPLAALETTCQGPNKKLVRKLATTWVRHAGRLYEVSRCLAASC